MEPVVRIWVVFCGVLFMFSGLFSSNSVARGLDYEAMIAHSFNLSGKVVSFSLPGGLDNGFPVEPGIAVANIYDKEKYSGDYYQPVLLERHWDYRGYFWQGLAGRYAMMKMLLSVSRVPEYEFLNVAADMPRFEQKIIQRMLAEHEEIYGVEFPISVSCDNLMVEAVPVLKCVKTDPARPDTVYMHVYVPIRDQFFLTFFFKAVPLAAILRTVFKALLHESIARRQAS